MKYLDRKELAIRLTLEVSPYARHDLEGGFKAITSNKLLWAQVLLTSPVLLGPRRTVRLEELLTVICEVMFVKSERRCHLHLQ